MAQPQDPADNNRPEASPLGGGDERSGQSAGPLFVVGVPRSGTTVLATRLAQVTGRVMAPETHFMPEVWAPLKHLDLRSDEAAAQAVARLEATRWFPDLGLARGLVLERFLSNAPRSWAGLFELVLGLHAQTRGASLLGEKTPGHYRHVATLLEWFPNGRVLFLMRDPRAVVASNMRAPFAPSYAWFNARRWTEFLGVYRRHADDPRVGLLRYEDLVADEAGTMARALTDLLGEDARAEPVADEASGAATPAEITVEGWRNAHLSAAARPIRRDSLDKWKSWLTEEEIWQVEAETGAEMTGFGYVREFPPEGGSESRSARGAAHAARFRRIYPWQRLALAIVSASSGPDQGFRGGLRALKGALLRGLGRIADRLTPLHAPTGGGARLVVTLPEELRAASSFAVPDTGAESWGLLLAELDALPWPLVIRAPHRPGLRAGRGLRRFFALRGPVFEQLQAGQPSGLVLYDAPRQGPKSGPLEPVWRAPLAQISGLSDAAVQEALSALNALGAQASTDAGSPEVGPPEVEPMETGRQQS